MTAKPLRSVPDGGTAPKRRPRKAPAVDLVSAVDRAVAGMHWLNDSDAALVAVTRAYASQIEAAADDPDEVAKRVGWMGPHLVNAIKALGGTPADRRALGVEGEVKGRLALLREARGGTE